MKKMIVTFINGHTISVPMESRRNFNKTKEAIANCEDYIDLGDYYFKLSEIQCVNWSDGENN